MRAIFLADGKVFTTGFSRMSERQLALWDPVSGRSGGRGKEQEWPVAPGFSDAVLGGPLALPCTLR